MNQLLMISILLLLIKCETWWGEVSGHDTSDGANGYAGSKGKAITAFYLCGDRKYRVHYKGDSKDTWTGEYWSCDPVGIGKSIDGISISGGYSYKVRYKNGNWEKAVTGYDINDSKNGYAGTLGKEIDAILIEGDNIYRAAYGGHSSNVEEVSKRVVKNLFGIDSSYSFDEETTIIDNRYVKVTVKLEHEYNCKLSSDINLVIKNGKPTDVNLGDFGNLLEELNKVINFKIENVQSNIKVSFSDGMNNGEVQFFFYWFEKKIVIYGGSKITQDHHSYRGGYRITIYLKDNINDYAYAILEPCEVFLKRLGRAGEIIMGIIRGMAKEIIKIISEVLAYLSSFSPSLAISFYAFCLMFFFVLA